MELRIWRRIYLTPFIRLNLYTRGFSVSVGHKNIGWLTFSRRVLRATIDLQGVPIGIDGRLEAQRNRSARVDEFPLG
jgi:hypothetical protein